MLLEGLEDIFESFWRLHSGRGFGFSGAEYIKVSEIIIYANAMEIKDVDSFIDFIQEMDKEFFIYLETKKKNRRGTGK